MPPPETDFNVKSVMAARYLVAALGRGPQVPWYVAAKLTQTDLFKFEVDSHFPLEKFTAALSNARRDSERPILSLDFESLSPDEAISVVELADLLSTRSPEVAASLADVLAESTLQLNCAQNTQALVNEYRIAAATADLKKILGAAAKADDALHEDWAWQVGLLADSVHRELQQAALLRIRSLLAVDLSDTDVLEVFKRDFDQALSTLAQRDESNIESVSELNAQVRTLSPCLAHLPWHASIGYKTLLNRINRERVTDDDIWRAFEPSLDELKPAWWFHIWLAVAGHPNFFGQSNRDLAWSRIALLADCENSENIRFRGHIIRYERLVRIYTYRIEVCLPTARADFVLWTASRLASDVLLALGNSPTEEIDQELERALENAKLVWQVSSPPFPVTSLRTAFLAWEKLWPPAIQASIRQWSQPGTPSAIVPEPARPLFTNLVRKASIQNLVIDTDSDNSTINKSIAFDFGTLHIEWSLAIPDSGLAEVIAQHATLVAELSSPEAVLSRLSMPVEGDDVRDIVAQWRWSAFLAAGKISTDQAADLITSKHWLDTVEPTLQVGAIELILQGLLAAPWRGRETLRVELAQWAALRCLAYLDDEPRRQVYGVATTLLSLKGATTSAIERLVHEDRANLFAEDRTQLRNTLVGMLVHAPAWVQGRIRAVLAVLGTS